MKPGRDINGAETHGQLSAFEGRRLQHSSFCSVTHGPWLAAVVEQESCADGAPNRWELVVPGLDGVGMFWFGQRLDRPSLPTLTMS